MESHVSDADHMSIITDITESTFLVNQSEAASQASDSTIGGRSSLRDDPRLKVYVTLGNGDRLLVAVPQTATVQDLQFATLRKAARFGVRASLAETVLRTVGPHAAVIDGDDLVQDFLDFTLDKTFSLELLNSTATEAATSGGATSTLSLPILPTVRGSRATESTPGNQAVYIRWITTHAAIDVSRLAKLPIDRVPVDSSTKLSDFHTIAIQRLCDGQPTSSTVRATGVRLWLKECLLSTTDNSATLTDLGLNGTMSDPLEVFVQFRGDEEHNLLSQVSETTTPQAAWGFNTTPRGLSTFVSSISILLKEIERGHVDLDTVLDALLEITHFPPVVLAFQKVYDSSLRRNVDVESLLLLADLFNSICKFMVPDWICASRESKLEGSRQILSWFHRLCVDAKQSSVPQRVHRVQVFRRPAMNVEDPTSGALFEHTSIIELPPLATEENATSSSSTTFVVSVEGPGEAMARRLALALRNSCSQTRWEYYVHHTENWKDFMERPALHRPGPADFDNLLSEANLYPAFKMVDPMRLGACLSADLPVITLSGKGYVSLYDQEDVGCGEREFYLFNSIEHKIKTNEGDPGQLISQRLEPIIAERKKHRAWEVDAWSEWVERANHGEPDESIVVCIDTSTSMNSEMHQDWNPSRDALGQTESRLHEVKEFFQQFSTRLSSYSLSANVGLVTFAGRGSVNVVQPLTMLQLDFRNKLAAVNAKGSTAIFNALSLAVAMLVTQKASFPRTKCRIILLTDGEDNSSDMTAESIAHLLYVHNIVLDAIVIGSDSTDDLFRLARMAGGYAFRPQTQHIFFQIFLLETFIDIRTRPYTPMEIPSKGRWTEFEPKQPDMQDAFSFPPCRPHPNQQDFFISLSSAHKVLRLNTATKSSRHSSAASTTSTTRSSRASTASGPRILLSEVKAMIDNAHPKMDVYVSQSNIGFWKVIMEGPEDSPYEKGAFLLYVDIGDNFPRVAPAIRFITPILHPNISKHGRICHPVFDREWSPHIHIYEVLQHIFGMLMSLESRDAIDPISALKFYTDPEEGRQQVAAYIRRFAFQSRYHLGQQILNGSDSSAQSSGAKSTSSMSTTTLTPGGSSSSCHSAPSTTGVPNAPHPDSRAKIASTNTQSSLARYLATRRGVNRAHGHTSSPTSHGPAPPPPLIAQPSGASNDTMSSSSHTLPLTASNLAAIPGSNGANNHQQPPTGNQSVTSGSQGGSQRSSRRSSFFAKLRRAGN